jgi:hypothetical protein
MNKKGKFDHFVKIMCSITDTKIIIKLQRKNSWMVNKFLFSLHSSLHTPHDCILTTMHALMCYHMTLYSQSLTTVKSEISGIGLARNLDYPANGQRATIYFTLALTCSTSPYSTNLTGYPDVPITHCGGQIS